MPKRSQPSAQMESWILLSEVSDDDGHQDLWGPRWTGRVAWAERATRKEWFERMGTSASPPRRR